MDIYYHHRIQFEEYEPGSWGDDVVLPDLINPFYLYKVGDRFSHTDVMGDEAIYKTFEVMEVKHELHRVIDGEQFIICKVKEIKDDKTEDAKAE